MVIRRKESGLRIHICDLIAHGKTSKEIADLTEPAY